MKKITFIFLFLCSISFGQNLGNPAIIGQTNRNQKVGKGLQVTDTLITDGVVILKNLATFGSGVDTGVGFKNGKIVRFLNTGGGDAQTLSISNDTLTISGGNSVVLPSGSSALFPNGIEFVNESRDFQASDAGKLLMLDGEVILTLPEIFPLEENDVVYIMLSGFGSKYQTQYAGNVIEGLSFGNGQPEVVKLGVVSFSGNLGFIQLSESAFNNDKTALRYLYDQSQNVIPLSGTISGSPITGDIEFANTYRLFGTVDDLTGYVGFDEGLPFLTAINTNTSESMTATMTTVGLSISTADVTGKRGVIGSEDYSSNITDLDYTQKIYVGFRGTATLSSGTVTVTTDKIKTGYKIYLSVNTPSGTQGFLSAPTGSIVDETEFVINSTSATDDSIVNWWIAP